MAGRAPPSPHCEQPVTCLAARSNNDRPAPESKDAIAKERIDQGMLCLRSDLLGKPAGKKWAKFPGLTASSDSPANQPSTALLILGEGEEGIKKGCCT